MNHESTRTTVSKTIQTLCFSLFAICMFSINCSAQIPITTTGTAVTSPPLAGSYSSLAGALADLNAVTSYTTQGTIIFSCAAGSETVPNTGLTIGSATLNPLLSAVNTVTIIKSSGTVTLNAGTGGTATAESAVLNGILVLMGVDYVTIDGLTLTDGNTTNPATMEFGIGFFRRNATDGCQHNTVQNCSITMQRINRYGEWITSPYSPPPMLSGSVGIRFVNSTPTLAQTRLMITTSSGENSYNRIYSNTINNGSSGISLYGGQTINGIHDDHNNDIGGSSFATGNSILNYGGGTDTVLAVEYAWQKAYGIVTSLQRDLNISYNTINNNNGQGVNHTATLVGIVTDRSDGASETVTHNIVHLTSGVTQFGNSYLMCGIVNQAGSIANGNTIDISYNSITVNYPYLVTTGHSHGISSFSTPSNLNINNNTIVTNTVSAAGTIFSIVVSNQGNITGNITVNSNTISANASSNTTLDFWGIYFSNNSPANSLTVNSNTFENITFSGSTGTTGKVSMIYSNWTPLSTNISNNNFNNLSLKTPSTVYLIYNSNAAAANGSKTIQDNYITGGCARTRASSNPFYCYYDNGNSPSSVTHNISGNNFSNISANTSGNFVGIYKTDSTNNPLTNIFGNTISNVNSLGNVYGIDAAGFGGSAVSPSKIYNNIISNLTSSDVRIGTYGINKGQSVYVSIFGNTISGLSGQGDVYGCYLSGSGTETRVYKNKIYGLTAGPLGAVTGINSSSAVINTSIYNNLIGNFTAPANSSAVGIKGIEISNNANTAVNLYYNSIFLDASSSSGDFGTAGIYANASNTATSGNLNMRNNIIVNKSVANGAGKTVAFQRSFGAAGELSNYAVTSNTNLFYAGSPSASNLIYYDVANAVQTITDYKNGVFSAGTIAPRDSSSVSEDLTAIFLSTVGTSPDYLHLNPARATLARNAGAAISGFTDDYDGNTRTATPDLGADEFAISDAALSDLVLSAGLFSPSFSSGIFQYTMSVGYAVTSTTITATASDIFATLQLQVNGGIYGGASSGILSSPIVLNVGVNVINVKVTAEDGTEQVYTVTITRANCNVTLTAIDSYVYANIVSGASSYTWRVTTMSGPNTGQVQAASTVLRNLRITQLGIYAFNTVYKVESAAMVNAVLRPYEVATGCTVTTPEATTNLSNCGASISAMTDVIYANIVQFATGYRFRITNVLNAGDTQTIDRTLREFRMNLLSNIQYNSNYYVEVAVRNTDGSYQAYGPICTVVTPIFPTTQVQNSQCQLTVIPSMTTIIYADNFAGAQGYRFKLTNISQGYSQQVDRQLRTFSLSNFTGLIGGQTYEVRVSLKLNNSWGPYGDACAVTVPGAARMIQSGIPEPEGKFKAVAYPNPFVAGFKLDVNTLSEEEVEVKVYDMIGRLIEVQTVNLSGLNTQEIGQQYPAGVYNVVVGQGGNFKTVRVIKR